MIFSPFFFLIFHTPSFPLIVCFRKSRNAAVKLMHTLPSQAFVLCFTIEGICWVESSLMRVKRPSCVRKPTTTVGTPSRNDCAQKRNILRSNLSLSSGRLPGSAVVFSSTHGIGSSALSGLLPSTQSTSPAMTKLVEPILVRIIEQYWLLLFTTCTVRPSISSRVHSVQGLGSTEIVSNL